MSTPSAIVARPKKQIVYLFGAGASYNALPIYADFTTRLTDFWNFFIAEPTFKRSQIYVQTYQEILKYGTPDTYAAALTLRGETEKLNVLKTFLTLFFAYEQFDKKGLSRPPLNLVGSNKEQEERRLMEDRINNTLDNRYVSFLCTVCLHDDKEEVLFPENMHFLSWNYDSQFELAYSRVFNKTVPLQNLREEMGIASLTNDKKKFIRLNGSADFNVKSVDDSWFDLSIDSIQEWKNSLILVSSGKSKETLINFGFDVYERSFKDDSEEDIFIRKIRSEARNLISCADIIVVVGYSFPDFNRRIDKTMFELVRNDVKVYVQDKNPEQIIQKLDGLKRGLRNKAHPITNTDQFWIPYEFWE